MAELLLVEDDSDVSTAVRAVLADEGYHVRIAKDGEKGLDELVGWRPAAVLLDVEMPVLDGPGMVLQMLLRDCGLEQLPVILLSGIADLPGVARRVGTPYYLKKPYDVDALLALIRRALIERRPPLPRAAGRE